MVVRKQRHQTGGSAKSTAHLSGFSGKGLAYSHRADIDKTTFQPKAIHRSSIIRTRQAQWRTRPFVPERAGRCARDHACRGARPAMTGKSGVRTGQLNAYGGGAGARDCSVAQSRVISHFGNTVTLVLGRPSCTGNDDAGTASGSIRWRRDLSCQPAGVHPRRHRRSAPRIPAASSAGCAAACGTGSHATPSVPAQSS